MDGVIYHGNRLLPGVESFLNWLKREKVHRLPGGLRLLPGRLRQLRRQSEKS